ncbi:MAG: hypothetical protein WCR68_03520 [Candidatus Dojkabacteria bacterium]
MINVQQNKNTVFLSALINKLFIKKDYEKHLLPLGVKIIQHFDAFEKTLLVGKLMENYKTDIPLKLYFEYMQLSLYLNKDFEFSFDEYEKKLIDKSEQHKKHVEIIGTTVKEIFEDINFDEFYNNEIKYEYGTLCKKLELLFKQKPEIEKELRGFWKISMKPSLFFIPNITSLGDCFGLRRANSFYSISSGKINKETNLSEYSPIHVYSNAIHEFSHQFFKEQIKELDLDNEIEKTSKEKLKCVELKNEIFNAYKHNYFEECFIQACTIRVEELTNIYGSGKVELKEKINKMLDSRESTGYIHVPIFYRGLIKKDSEYVVHSFLRVLNNIG